MDKVQGAQREALEQQARMVALQDQLAGLEGTLGRERDAHVLQVEVHFICRIVDIKLSYTGQPGESPGQYNLLGMYHFDPYLRI